MEKISTDVVVRYEDVTNACMNLSQAIALVKEDGDSEAFVRRVEKTLERLRMARKNAPRAHEVTEAFIRYLQDED